MENPQLNDWTQLWALRVLDSASACQHLFSQSATLFQDDGVAKFLNLDKWMDKELTTEDRREIYGQLTTRRQHLESNIGSQTVPPCFKRGLDRLGRIFGLSAMEKAILMLTVLIQYNDPFGETVKLIPAKGETGQQSLYAKLLRIPVSKIRTALNIDGVLFKKGFCAGNPIICRMPDPFSLMPRWSVTWLSTIFRCKC